MKVIFAADHRGFNLKEQLKTTMTDSSYEIIDVGATTIDPQDDYVDYAVNAVRAISDPTDRIVLICGSGHGMDMTANRFPNVRAILGFNETVVIQGREHEDANALILPADWLNLDQANRSLHLFLTTTASNEARHLRRRDKLAHVNQS